MLHTMNKIQNYQTTPVTPIPARMEEAVFVKEVEQSVYATMDTLVKPVRLVSIHFIVVLQNCPMKFAARQC